MQFVNKKCNGCLYKAILTAPSHADYNTIGDADQYWPVSQTQVNIQSGRLAGVIMDHKRHM